MEILIEKGSSHCSIKQLTYYRTLARHFQLINVHQVTLSFSSLCILSSASTHRDRSVGDSPAHPIPSVHQCSHARSLALYRTIETLCTKATLIIENACFFNATPHPSTPSTPSTTCDVCANSLRTFPLSFLFCHTSLLCRDGQGKSAYHVPNHTSHLSPVLALIALLHLE